MKKRECGPAGTSFCSTCGEYVVPEVVGDKRLCPDCLKPFAFNSEEERRAFIAEAELEGRRIAETYRRLNADRPRRFRIGRRWH